jgi:hypothetical protein
MLAFVGLVLTAALAEASWSALIKLLGEAVARHALFRCAG